jgi:hypothetical protein
MSDTGAVTPETGAPTPEPTEPAAEEPKPTETVEFWKTKAREQEKRAKENASAAERLAQYEESQKTEAQRAADRLAAAEQDAATARAEALRYRIATRFKLSDDDAETFLTASDEETLTKVAERLAALNQAQTAPGTPAPDPSQGTRGQPSGKNDMNNIIRGLTGRG